MQIGKKFNQLTKGEYLYYIDHHKKYSDFNTLGLYRSIDENEHLNVEDKKAIRDYANTIFGKTFEFLQVKDPETYFKLITLGETLTRPDEWQIWADIRANQQAILKDKQIKHRNFGTYAKHSCGYPDCPLNGLMVRQGSRAAEWHMYFETDQSTYGKADKAQRARTERKQKATVVRDAKAFSEAATYTVENTEVLDEQRDLSKADPLKGHSTIT